MKNIVLFDNKKVRGNLLPLAFTRPIANFRVGITTIFEKWQAEAPAAHISFLTDDYLSPIFPCTSDADTLFVAGHLFPNDDFTDALMQIKPGEGLTHEGEVIAFRGSKESFIKNLFPTHEYMGALNGIFMLYDIFMKNGEVLLSDFKKLTNGRESQPISATNTIIGNPTFPDGSPKIFIEEGAKVEGAFLNVNNGPIYIGKDAEVMEGSAIRAPFAACEHAVVNMCSKIYGATTLGPYCKVGGELNNVVMQAYSNKAHDGFLGNAVIGEWCNIGGGTTASNLKNDYTEIKLWNYPTRRFLRTGLQFCGLIMADHAKCGINCMFNTATVIGVGSNIYGSGFPRNFIASFLEGGTMGFSNVAMNKFFGIAERMMVRRGKQLSDAEKAMFETIYQIAENYK